MSTSVATSHAAVCEEFRMTEDVKAVALEELREDDSVREQALQQLREWIAKHPAIKKCRTDTPFLLRFLRTKKFSVPQACAMLEKYLTVRQMYPQWFQKLDINEPSMEAIMDSGYLVPLLKRDANNRQIILSCAGRFDPYKFTSDQMARAHSLVCEALMDDQLNQVYGYTYINDESGLLMGHVSLWSLTDIKAILGCIQNSTPMRHKETHFVNIPTYANQLVVFAVSILSDKLKSRIMLYKTVDEMKEKMDPSILPKEYGGEVPMADMIAALKKTLRERREAILALDDMIIDIDSTIKLDSDMKEELGTGVIGSFRKLQVD